MLVFRALPLVGLVVFVILFLVNNSLQQQASNFPILITNNFRSKFVSVQRDKRLRHSKMRSVQVIDDLSCVQECTRVGDSCKSVNFKKKTVNGIHSCELITTDKYTHPDALVDDDEFDCISTQLPLFTSCAEIHKNGGTINGVYEIVPIPSLRLNVYCDLRTGGGGWTVIQKRIDGSVDFFRDWIDYKRGFGNKLGEYWLGLDNIHAMTSQRQYRLRFDMEDFDGNTRYAEYDNFVVADAAAQYRVTVGQYSGDAGDSIRYMNGKSFSTRDRDNDRHVSTNCALTCTGAWWYKRCQNSNPNGLYLNGAGIPVNTGINWNRWHGPRYSLKRIEMKIRPVEYN